jgi:hypothetical protein
MCAACAADLTTTQPSLGLDGLYTVLGLLLGVNAFNERTALLKVLEQRASQASSKQADGKGGDADSSS